MSKQVLISTHPERYGFDNRKFPVVVIDERTGEKHPATNYKAAKRIARSISKTHRLQDKRAQKLMRL